MTHQARLHIWSWDFFGCGRGMHPRKNQWQSVPALACCVNTSYVTNIWRMRSLYYDLFLLPCGLSHWFSLSLCIIPKSSNQACLKYVAHEIRYQNLKLQQRTGTINLGQDTLKCKIFFQNKILLSTIKCININQMFRTHITRHYKLKIAIQIIRVSNLIKSLVQDNRKKD